MQELDSLMYSPATLQDLLGNTTQIFSNPNEVLVNSPNGLPNNGDFTDMLAEFTLTGNVLSPDTLGKSPEISSGGSGFENEVNYEGGSGNSSKSPEELMLDNRSPMDSTSIEGSYEFIRSDQHQPSDLNSIKSTRAKQLADAISNMDSATQAQLLKALLPGGVGGVIPKSRMNSPKSQSTRQSSYERRPSQPTSRHSSPPAFRPYQPLTPSLLQQLPGTSEYFDALSLVHNTALNTSLPPSVVSSPHASPFLHPTNYYSQQQQLQQQPLQQQQQQQQQPLQPLRLQSYPQYSNQPTSQSFNSNSIPANSFSNTFSPNTFARNSPGDIQAQLALEALNIGFTSPNNGQIQTGGIQVQTDMGVPNGSNTGSYSTTAETEDWGENDFMFSPLMSPALTPHSVFSVASSLPPSASCLPPPHNLANVNPNDFFSPLGSPAILPQNFHQIQTSSTSYQQLSQSQLQTMSPQLMATTGLGEVGGDAGISTAAGSGRRGAGGASKKSRPSPLLKPTPDNNLRRKKLPNERKNSSTTGMRSVTTSPFLGPAAFSMTASSSTGSGGSKTSPPDGDTPSPVDLAMSEISVPSQSPYIATTASSTSYLAEFMGPPPLPSSSNPSSRRASLIQPNSSEGGWNPVTPATLMNFSNDVVGTGLSSLNYPASQQPQQTDQQFQIQNHQLQQQQQQENILLQLQLSQQEQIQQHQQQQQQQQQQQDSIQVDGEDLIQVDSNGKAKTKKAIAAATKAANNANGVNAKGKAKAAPSKPKVVKAKSNIDSTYSESNPISTHPSSVIGADIRRTSHKAAEQKRRDSLKQCFEELRKILPPMTHTVEPEDRRPGEGNVGGQRAGSIDPENPNRGVSKVALLRRSNDYVGTLVERIDRRDIAIDTLRGIISELKLKYGEEEDDLLDEFDHLDRDEQAPKTMEFYENLDSDDETEYRPKATKKGVVARRKSNAETVKPNSTTITTGAGARRSSRNFSGVEDDMEVERD